MSRFEYVRRFFSKFVKRTKLYFLRKYDRSSWGVSQIFKAATFFIKTVMERSQTKILE